MSAIVKENNRSFEKEKRILLLYHLNSRDILNRVIFIKGTNRPRILTRTNANRYSRCRKNKNHLLLGKPAREKYQQVGNRLQSYEKGACYDLAIVCGTDDDDGLAAFSFNNLKKKKDGFPIVNTWETKEPRRDAYFLGLLTRPDINNCIYIANCQCIMKNFKQSQGNLQELVIPNLDILHTCTTEKCCSVSCDVCFKDNSTRKNRYECPFRCDEAGNMYNDFNNLAKIKKKLEKAQADTKVCATCGTTQLDFYNKKPYCRTMVWTSVPKTTDKHWCNSCRVINEGRGRASIVTAKRQLAFQKAHKDLSQEDFAERMAKLEEQEKKQDYDRELRKKIKDEEREKKEEKKREKKKRRLEEPTEDVSKNVQVTKLATSFSTLYSSLEI